jgi:hypothetical protein
MTTNILKLGYRGTVKQGYSYVIMTINILKRGYMQVIMTRNTVSQGTGT